MAEDMRLVSARSRKKRLTEVLRPEGDRQRLMAKDPDIDGLSSLIGELRQTISPKLCLNSDVIGGKRHRLTRDTSENF
jgi:hypothetical protein